jgi:amylosucrase
LDPAHADDNRWMHRPPMDWEAAGRRHDPASVEGRIWSGLERLAHARRSTRATHAQGAGEPIWTGNDHVFGLWREHAGERLLVLANFTAAEQSIHLGPVWERGLHPTPTAAVPDGRPLRTGGEFLTLQPYQHLWIA